MARLERLANASAVATHGGIWIPVAVPVVAIDKTVKVIVNSVGTKAVHDRGRCTNAFDTRTGGLEVVIAAGASRV